MDKGPKNQLDGLLGKARALMSLPWCGLREIISRLNLSTQEELDYRAQHESGHALIYVLAERPIEEIAISSLQSVTRANLNTLLGEERVRACSGGRVVVDEKTNEEFVKQHPDRMALVFLAGFASTNNPRYEEFLVADLKEHLAMGEDSPWGDIIFPFSYIQERFEAIHKRAPTNREVSEIFNVIIEKIRLIFADEKFTKALEQIKDLLIKKKKLERDVSGEIILALSEIGFSSKDVSEMKEKIFSIDIDQIIRDYSESTAL